MVVADRIKAEIERRNLSVTDAADLLSITRPALSNVVNGNASLSIRLALTLEARFGMNAEKLLIAQLKQDIAATKADMEESVD